MRRRSYNIFNHSKWRRIEKDLSKCPMIGVSTLSGHEICIVLRYTNELDSEKFQGHFQFPHEHPSLAMEWSSPWLLCWTSGYLWPSGTVKSICFLFFFSGILGETKQNKSAKLAIFIEFVFGDRQKKKQNRILWNFYFLVSPLANFHRAMIFFSFLSFFFSPRIFFFLFFFFFFPRTDSSQKS